MESYRRRWLRHSRLGTVRRLGGGPSAIGRVVVPVASAGLVLWREGQLSVSSLMLALAGAIGGVLIWVVVLAAWSLFAAPGELAAADQAAYVARESSTQVAIAALREANAGMAQALNDRATQAELARRSGILRSLRTLYFMERGMPMRMYAGLDPLPKDWVEQHLEQMGETWRQDEYR